MKQSSRQAVAASHVFDGSAVHADHAVIIEDTRIVALIPRHELSSDISLLELPDGTWLAPGFIDVQVNGGGDVLFNDDPSPEGIHAIVAAHRKFGTTSLLPTLISDTDAKMAAARAAVEGAIGKEPGVLGIHWEGPFLSPERAGVHDRNMLRAPDASHEELLTSLRAGVTLVTLAPEQVPRSFIRNIVNAGVRVALGHSMATYDQTRQALDDGLTGFTHLFNAMRPLMSREPGPIAAALETPGAFYGLIVDGEHVAPAMLRLALRGTGTAMLVTDAMPPVGGQRTGFTLYGREIVSAGGSCTTTDGTLAGAALDMATAVSNCVRTLGVPLPDALRLASLAPATFLGLQDSLGRIAPGYRADLVAFEPNAVLVRATWVAGTRFANGHNGI